MLLPSALQHDVVSQSRRLWLESSPLRKPQIHVFQFLCQVINFCNESELRSSGSWRCVVLHTNISEVHAASIFRVKWTEDGGSMDLRNIGVYHNTTHCHNLEDLNLKHHDCESRVMKLGANECLNCTFCYLYFPCIQGLIIKFLE
jgi:hypothetical protein